MSTRLLLVEDEPNVADVLIINLEAEGYELIHAASLAAAEAALDQEFSLIILDVMLPDGNGVDFADTLRQRDMHIPILMLTAKDTTEDIVEGLEAGADDYLCKPFKLDELLGRIAALLRRRNWDSKRLPAQSELCFPACCVDLVSGRIKQDDDIIQLTDIELKLLRYFQSNPYENLSRDDIMLAVWDAPAGVKSRTLDNFIVRFRKLFEEDHKQPQHFLTVYGSGYRFIPPQPKS